jgi:Na+-driven multidrug efflux pump
LIVIIGLSNCITPFVGQNWGARQFERAHRALIFGYQFSLAWGLLITVLLAMGNTFIPEFFIEDLVVISTVSLYLLIVPLSYSAVGCLFVTNAFLNAIGLSYSVAMITVIRYFVLYVPLALIAMKFFGPKGIFTVISLTNLIMGAAVYFWARNKLKSSTAGWTLAGRDH